MNYYNIYKQAGPEDKIRKYNITDKYQQAFIFSNLFTYLILFKSDSKSSLVSA